MKINLGAVEAAAEGRELTSPGTIAVFNIEKVEFMENDNGMEIFEVSFGRPEDNFRERFFLSEKAAPRFVYFFGKVMGTETLPDNEAGIIAALTNKKIALKVTGQINSQTGKGYPSLPFTGFARPEAEIAELTFSAKENVLNAQTIEAQIQSSNSGGGASAPVGAAAGIAESDSF